MDEVHSLFGNLPHGDVVLKLMRPANVAAVHHILQGIASAKRKSREGNFMVEVFGQAEAVAVSPVPEPRPEHAPSVDPEILNLFENDGESPVFEEREVSTCCALLTHWNKTCFAMVSSPLREAATGDTVYCLLQCCWLWNGNSW